MPEVGDLRPSSVQKGDAGGSFSDADSGFDDPGVITIPVTRTVVHKSSSGRKISSTSTDYISVQKKNENANSREVTPSPLDDEPPRMKFSNSLSSLNSSGRGPSVCTSNEVLSSTEFINEGRSSAQSDATMDSFDLNEFDVSIFTKEIKKENEDERKYRLLSAPRGKRKPIRPTIREVNVTNNISYTEETIRKVPKKRFRSKSADGRKWRGAQSIFSPLYTKVLSPETMRSRKMWADVIKKDCILEEEYYKVPYEECNREIIMGRFSNPETLLYNFRRLKNERMAEAGLDAKSESLKRQNMKMLALESPFKDNYNNTNNKSNNNNNNNTNNSNNNTSNNNHNNDNNNKNHHNTKTDTISITVNNNNKNNYNKNNININKNCNSKKNKHVTYEIDDNTNHKNIVKEDILPVTTKLFSLNSLMPRAEIVTFHNPIPDNKATDDLKQLILDLNWTAEPSASQHLWDDLTTYVSDETDRDSYIESPNNVSSGDELQNMSDNDSNSTDKPTFDECLKKKNKKRVSFSNENEELIFDSNFSDTDSSSVFEDSNESEIIAQKPIICLDDAVSETNDYVGLGRFISDSTRSQGSEQAASGKESAEKGFIVPIKLYDESSPILSSFNYTKPLDANREVNRDIIKGKYNDTFQTSCANDSDVINIDDNNNNDTKLEQPKAAKRSIFFTEFEKPKLSDIYNRYPLTTDIKNSPLEKTNQLQNIRGDKVNIYMTKGPNFVDHTIHLLTSQTCKKPNVTVSRIKVPINSIRDQLEWIISIHQQHQQDLINNMQAIKSTGFFSPTPSCGSDTSSGCFSERNSPFRSSKTFPTSL